MALTSAFLTCSLILLRIHPDMSMVLTSGSLTCSLGTVIVSTPFSIAAFTSSTLAFSGNLNRLRNLPLLLSTRCQLSFFSSFSRLLSPLICRTLPSSSSTFTSSFFRPGRSALKTWASGVSFQSIRALANADVSLPKLELVRALLFNGNS
ncbi:Proline transporter 1 [Cinnamomum micranthum f. kanehirae]|uniref:Proline transporter 1 n=1 Tax=Cinnamomum micranthum f. kanehirae TaxID=337451 RepID=A0A443Q2U6_9MAGN|nr:Proline transporter 1 [Cinnamomum micranthum f. kanehirae]